MGKNKEMKARMIEAIKYYDNGRRVYGLFNIVKNGKVIDVVERSLRFENNIGYILYKNEKVFIRK